jgi:hypothetical protein
MGGVSPVVESGAIIDDVMIRVSVCLRSSGACYDSLKSHDGRNYKSSEPAIEL